MHLWGRDIHIKPISLERTGWTSMDDIRRQYEDNGYYVARAVFSPAEIIVLERDFNRIVAQARDSGEDINTRWRGSAMDRLGANDTVIYHTHNVQCYSEAWLRALQKKEFLDIVEQLIGPDIILHHTRLFQKPAEKGAPFPMHRDWPYFPTIQDTMMAGIIHVAEATDEMGCLRVYPGSHKLGRWEGTKGKEDLNQEFIRNYPLERALPLEAGPGDVAFFHYFTVHGSQPNLSHKVRKTVLVQMYAGTDCVEEGNEHPNARLALRGWNHCAKRSAVAKSA
jgi:phytanoyl-CoA hydroxylase